MNCRPGLHLDIRRRGESGREPLGNDGMKRQGRHQRIIVAQQETTTHRAGRHGCGLRKWKARQRRSRQWGCSEQRNRDDQDWWDTTRPIMLTRRFGGNVSSDDFAPITPRRSSKYRRRAGTHCSSPLKTAPERAARHVAPGNWENRPSCWSPRSRPPHHEPGGTTHTSVRLEPSSVSFCANPSHGRTASGQVSFVRATRV